METKIITTSNDEYSIHQELTSKLLKSEINVNEFQKQYFEKFELTFENIDEFLICNIEKNIDEYKIPDLINIYDKCFFAKMLMYERYKLSNDFRLFFGKKLQDSLKYIS